MNRNDGTKGKRNDAIEPETVDNAEAEDTSEDDVEPGTATYDRELIEIADDGSTLGTRQRTDKTCTPQRGLNKKKARVDLTGDSPPESEEEIIFESPSAHSSANSSTSDSPPEPRRLCNLNDTPPMDQDARSQSSISTDGKQDEEEARPRTMAAVTAETLRPMQPAAHNILKSCRYAAQLTVPPDASPVKKAGELLQNVLREIQKQAGTQVWLAAWQSNEDMLVCKKPKDIPTGSSSEDRDIFTRLFDNYMSLTPDIEKTLFLKIHFVTQSPDAIKIPLKEIGLKVETLKDKFGFRLNPNPNPCQSHKVTTIGWCFGSTKSMDSEALIQGLRQTLKIPDHVTLGAQWRTIADQHGRKFAWPKDKNAPRPPQAIHIDIDDAHIGVWYPKMAKLWKKGATKRVNYLQLRLVPCFTTQVGKSLTPIRHANTVYMAQKQAHFVNTYTTRLTSSHILALDVPIGENHMTLRRYLMMKAPEKHLTDRIFLSVDPAYRGSEFVLTTPKKFADQALQVLHTMIPECLHLHGPEAARWFTNVGLMAYQDVKWDDKNKTATSLHDDTAVDMVEEDFCGMGDEWKAPHIPEPTGHTTAHIESIPNTGMTVGELLDARAKLGVHDDTSSFGDVFGRSHSGSTIARPPRPQNHRTRRVGFSDEPPNTDQPRTPPPDDATVSTMGTEATTGSTRRSLRHQMEINNALRTEGNQIAEDRDRLQRMLERLRARMDRHGLTMDDDATCQSDMTPELPSATRVPPSTGADSAGRRN